MTLWWGITIFNREEELKDHMKNGGENEQNK